MVGFELQISGVGSDHHSPTFSKHHLHSQLFVVVAEKHKSLFVSKCCQANSSMRSGSTSKKKLKRLHKLSFLNTSRYNMRRVGRFFAFSLNRHGAYLTLDWYSREAAVSLV